MSAGWGGKRPGSGRKGKADHLRLIDGGASHRKTPDPNNDPAENLSSAPPPTDVLACPEYLKEDQDATKVWAELAPLAHQARTLVPETARAFSLLCRLVPLEIKLAAIAAGGPEHRGTLTKLNALMLQFNLSPNGKPLYKAKAEEPKKTGLARFR